MPLARWQLAIGHPDPLDSSDSHSGDPVVLPEELPTGQNDAHSAPVVERVSLAPLLVSALGRGPTLQANHMPLALAGCAHGHSLSVHRCKTPPCHHTGPSATPTQQPEPLWRAALSLGIFARAV